MAETMRNIGALFGDTKTRNIILITGLIMFSAVAVGVFGFKRSRPETPTAAVQVSQNLGNIQSIAGVTQATPAQAKLQSQLNEQRYQSETSKGKSFLPTITSVGKPLDSSTETTQTQGKSVTFSPTSKAGKGKDKGKGDKDSKSKGQDEVDALKLQVVQQQQQLKSQQTDQIAQQRQQALEKAQESMRKQSQAIMAAWNGPSGNPTQQYVAGVFAEKEDQEKAKGAGAEGSGGKEEEGQETEAESKPASPAVIKAGDIVFAILNTAVNSDEPGPVLATIVSGKYRGAKLIGSIQKAPTITGVKPATVSLSFKTMSVPEMPTSTSVSAVAIDPDTARTALASDVDKHYLERYGTLFASSFLEGYGNAITSSGSVAFTPSTGGSTTFQQQLNPSEQFMAALGEVGTSWGEEMEDIFDRPYTITVDSGTSLGILFLSDVTNLGTG